MTNHLMTLGPPAVALAAIFHYLVRVKPVTVWIVALLLVVIGMWIGLEGVNDWTWENRSKTLIYGESFLQAVIPVSVIMGISYAARLVKNETAKWIVIFVSTIGFVLVWPFIALLVVCTTGLDCV